MSTTATAQPVRVDYAVSIEVDVDNLDETQYAAVVAGLDTLATSLLGAATGHLATIGIDTAKVGVHGALTGGVDLELAPDPAPAEGEGDEA